MFGRNGIGLITAQAVTHRDNPILLAVVVIATFGYVIINLAVDLPAGANLGQGWIELRVVGAGVNANNGHFHYFAIQEFRRPEFEVTTRAETPIDLNVFRSHGVDPTRRRVLALKGKGHFRAAFEPSR